MSDRRQRQCLKFEPNSFNSYDNISTNDAPPLPSASMSESAYIRIHANAPPSKLRDIVKKHIFPNDDVNYLKRLVGDIGMEYVFRFLWYDGPKPTSYFDEWDDTLVKSFPPRSVAIDGWNESPTRGESNWGSATYSSRKAASAVDQSRGDSPKAPEREIKKAKDAKRSGRTWIQYCCATNAHQCLHWIFREIVTSRLKIVNEELERQMATNKERRGSLTRQSNSRKLRKEGDMMYIIKEMLEYPSHCYCATNYVAVATFTGSHDCLLLLLQYGGLDPNMHINSHGSTAAHLAAWKDNIECLQVLQSGCYSCGFSTDNDLDSSASEERFSDCSGSDESYHAHDDPKLSCRDAFMSFTAVPRSRTKKWIANWNIRNERGETPMHVAAKEGSCGAMQFFLDLAISFADAEAMREQYEGASRRPQCLSEDGVKGITQHLDESDHVSCPSVDFSLRTNDGMDCAALASQNNHANVIEILANAIRQLKEIDDDKCRDIKQSASDGVWHNPLLHIGTSPQAAVLTKPPPQSHLPSLRRRANTDPVRFQMDHKIPKPSLSEHNVNEKSALPFYYPSLNLHNPQEKNNHETPIHLAARQGNVDVIRALFNSGCCNTSSRDSLGQTALHIAVLANRFAVVQFFAELNIEQFRKFDVVDILGKTPLYTACSLGNSSIARILTPISNWRVVCHEKRQSPDSPLLLNVASQPPLHAAVVNNYVNTVSVLLECGVDVDQHDVNGRTAINAAAKLGYYEMCQKLILHGADVNARSSKGGPTPFQKAKKYKHPEVADLLYEFGGR